METVKGKTITVETTIKAPVETVWECWTEPRHITNWYFASDDWHAPLAENDLKLNGKFKTRMAAKTDQQVSISKGYIQRFKSLRLLDTSWAMEEELISLFRAVVQIQQWPKHLIPKIRIHMNCKKTAGNPFLTTSENMLNKKPG